MYNVDQEEYTVDMIKENKGSANKADAKSFWCQIATSACVVLIGAAALLSKHEIIPEDIAIGAQTLSGVLGVNCLIGAINCNSDRNEHKNRASDMHYNRNMDILEGTTLVKGKHAPKNVRG